MQKLQLDSTVMYGLGKYGSWLATPDTQSTSRTTPTSSHGLPPGAIDNPGEAALKAALNPAKGNWLYFVTTDPERHITKFAYSYRRVPEARQELVNEHGARMTRAAVLGAPIAHSLSPVLHRAAYAALGLDWSYEAIECREEDLPDVLPSGRACP